MIDFIIIGAQKSASTFIHHCLSEHPQLFMPSNEVPFFENPDFQEASINELQHLFANAESDQKKGIKRPNYLGKPECPAHIYKICPKVQLIVVLRNPIERALSAYYHSILYGFIPAVNHEIGLRNIIEGRWEQKYKRAKEIIEFGFYYKHLMRYLNYFSLDQMFIFLQDEIKREKSDIIKKIYQFLDIDAEFFPVKSINTKPQAVIYHLKRIRWLRLKNRFIYTYNSDCTRLKTNRTMSLLPKIFCEFIDKIDIHFFMRFTAQKKPGLSEELKYCLYNIYREDIESLEGLLHLDLSGWKILN